MKHYRRRKILTELNRMYLDNYNAAASFQDACKLESYMATVTENLRKQSDVYPSKVPKVIQLDLFETKRQSFSQPFPDEMDYLNPNTK